MIPNKTCTMPWNYEFVVEDSLDKECSHDYSHKSHMEELQKAQWIMFESPCKGLWPLHLCRFLWSNPFVFNRFRKWRFVFLEQQKVWPPKRALSIECNQSYLWLQDHRSPSTDRSALCGQQWFCQRHWWCNGTLSWIFNDWNIVLHLRLPLP